LFLIYADRHCPVLQTILAKVQHNAAIVLHYAPDRARMNQQSKNFSPQFV
jgi:hypothetical protein